MLEISKAERALLYRKNFTLGRGLTGVAAGLHNRRAVLPAAQRASKPSAGPAARISLRKMALSLISIVAAVYVAVFLFGLLLSEPVIFQPHPAGYRDDNRILKLTSRNGRRISAVYLQNPAASYTLLFSHGNAEDLGDDLLFLQVVRNAGFSVLAYDYQGYGTSAGRPSERNVYEDEEAAYQYLTRNLGTSPEHIIAWGRSLGGAAAVDLASRRPLAGLILESSFVSAFRVLTRVPLLPVDKFRNLDKIAGVRCPVLVIHGEADRVVPFWHGQKLFAAAGGAKRSLWVPGAGHNDVADVAGARYFQALQEFAASLDSQPAAVPAP